MGIATSSRVVHSLVAVRVGLLLPALAWPAPHLADCDAFTLGFCHAREVTRCAAGASALTRTRLCAALLLVVVLSVVVWQPRSRTRMMTYPWVR